MNRTSPLLKLLAVLFAVTMIAAACGDDDSDADGSGDETTQDEGTTTGTDEADTDETGSDGEGDEPSGDAAAGGDLPDEFFSDECQDAYNAFLGAQTQLSGAFTGQVGDAEEAQAAIEALADNAPDEVADAFETWAAEMGVFFEALADLGFEGDGQPTAEQMTELIQASESVDQAAIEEAGEEISAYFEGVCGE